MAAGLLAAICSGLLNNDATFTIPGSSGLSTTKVDRMSVRHQSSEAFSSTYCANFRPLLISVL